MKYTFVICACLIAACQRTTKPTLIHKANSVGMSNIVTVDSACAMSNSNAGALQSLDTGMTLLVELSGFDGLITSFSSTMKKGSLSNSVIDYIVNSKIPFDNKLGAAMRQVYNGDCQAVTAGIYFLKRLLNVCKDSDQKQLVRTRLGIAYSLGRESEASLNCFEDALAVIKRGESKIEKRVTLRGLSIASAAMNRYDDALRYAKDCYAYEKQSGCNEDRLTHTYIAIPIIYYNSAQYSKAIEAVDDYNNGSDSAGGATDPFMMRLREDAATKRDGVKSNPYGFGF